MDFSQPAVTTLHDLTGETPDAPHEESAVVVPITGTSVEAVTPGAIFETLAAVGPADVVVPLRAPPGVAGAFADWVGNLPLPVTVLWCNSPAVETLLANHGLDGESGKGRDVWLGLGVAADRADYVAVHDADARTYDESWVPRLLAPLTGDHSFVKGYYARVEDGRLYGRLARLFVAPLLRAVADEHDDPLLEFLTAFRYPLAGEMAMTAPTARRVRAQRDWGLEIGLLGEVYDVVGPAGCAQVDLGVHRHDHRPVEGETGLATMAGAVGETLCRVLEAHDLAPDYGTLPERYRRAAARHVEQYAADAAHNGLSYDRDGEREQVEAYGEHIGPPGADTRLPAWEGTAVSAAEIGTASARALDAVRTTPEMDDA